MKRLYKSVDITTLKGIKRAEMLKAKGWQITSVCFTTVIMEKGSD